MKIFYNMHIPHISIGLVLDTAFKEMDKNCPIHFIFLFQSCDNDFLVLLKQHQ